MFPRKLFRQAASETAGTAQKPAQLGGPVDGKALRRFSIWEGKFTFIQFLGAYYFWETSISVGESALALFTQTGLCAGECSAKLIKIHSNCGPDMIRYRTDQDPPMAKFLWLW